MDRNRFDSLTRLFVTTGSRRSAVGALVTSLLLGQEVEGLAKKGKGKNNSGDGNGHPDRRKGKNGNNKHHNKNHKKDHAANSASDDAAAAAPSSSETATADAPTAGSGTTGRSSSNKRRKNGKGRNKKGKDKAKASDSSKAVAAEATTCCGAKSCPLPSKGSNSYECAYPGANLSGRDMSLANLGKIDGKKTNFSGSNVAGVNFGSACLQGSNFRNADVSRTNFGSACLFGADFTSAKNFNFQVNFSTALLCGTILPDGTISDRDCGKATTCCAQCAANADCGSGKVCCSGQCKSGVCCAAGDCATQTCQNKTCTNNQCSYTPISGTTGPNCTTQCCNGVCCPQGQTCNQGVCSCTRNCTGKVCGSDGCSGSCGTCPQNSTCNGNGTACTCNQGYKQCGAACIPNAQCCTNGQATCPQGQTCCVSNGHGTCQECCGSDAGTCPAVPSDAVCKVQSCQGGTCTLVNSPNGQPGSNCAAPRQCQNGVCVGCVTPETCPQPPVCKIATCVAGQCGTANQQDGTICPLQAGGNGVCASGTCVQCLTPANCPTPPTCKVATCNGNTCGAANAENGPGTGCPAPGCCNGVCCTGAQVCFQNSCCQPITTCPAGACGNVPTGCGSTINCGSCPEQTCKAGTCEANNTCTYAGQPNNQPGTKCAAPGFCCNGSICCSSGQVCTGNGCCTPESKETTCAGGKCGSVTNNCGQSVNCGACPVQTCKNASCSGDTHACNYTPVTNGQQGPNCTGAGQSCCNGNACCTTGQVCTGGGCCTPESKETTCAGGKCGNVNNNCGQVVNCGACPEQICKAGTCEANNTCSYAGQPNNQPGTKCAAPGFCCNGNACCTAGQVCTGNGCCTPATNTCDGKCGNVTNNCGQVVNCGACPVQTCQNATCNGATSTCNYTPVTNGQPGPNCTGAGQTCCNGSACCTTGQVCTGGGCCTPQTQDQTCSGKCGNVINNCGQTVVCGTCAVQTCKAGVCNGTTHVCEYTNQTNGQPGNNCSGAGQSCCNGVCCPSGQTCIDGTCKGNCGSNPPCGSGKTCCGGVCQSGICCAVTQGCDPGTCCAGETCIPVVNPTPGSPSSTCQVCCQNGPDCRAVLGDGWNCVGDPKFCSGTACGANGGKCCRPQ